MYSVVRYGALFQELEDLKKLDPVSDADAVKKTLAKFKLEELPITA